jgi:hypothetical protein
MAQHSARRALRRPHAAAVAGFCNRERLQDLGLQPTMTALSFLNSWMYLTGRVQAQAEIIGSSFDLDLQSRLLQLPDLDTRVACSPALTLLVTWPFARWPWR